MTQCAIETRDLSKFYGEREAVTNLTVRVARGEVFGFLGPNGAGKTTAVKMLLGLVRPSSGDGAILELPWGRSRRAARSGHPARNSFAIKTGRARADPQHGMRQCSVSNVRNVPQRSTMC